MTPDPETLHISESFLVADIGHTNTNVALFDVVENSYRLIGCAQAATTTDSPWHDATTGVQQAIARLTNLVQRPLLDRQGWLINPATNTGAGVDIFAAAVSAAAPLRTILVGLLDDVSLTSARRALQTVYAQEVDHLSLADTRSEAEQIDAIIQHRPDLILIAGGTDGGDVTQLTRSVETVATALELLAQTDVHRPEVVFAGNRQMRATVASRLSGIASLHTVDNVRPRLEAEQLHEASQTAASLYDDLKVSTLPGFDDVAAWCRYPVVPTAQAFAGITRYFAAVSRGRVLGVDVGSNTVTFVAATPEHANLLVRSDLGLGRPLSQLPRMLDSESVRQWLPANGVDDTALQDFIMNKALYPFSLPMTESEMRLEQAITREMLRQTVAQAGASWGWAQDRMPPFNLLLLRGGIFRHTPRPGQIALMVLDALQPTGVFALTVDRYGVLPALGVLAPHKPLVAVQALEGGVLVDLGWVIALAGRGQPGQKALELRMEAEGQGALEVEVAFGALEVLPLPLGQTARLTLKLASRQFDIGYGPGVGHSVTVQGGLVGVIVDARGRPLTLPTETMARAERLRQWLWDMGG
ncbi:MAG: glutamate mutase L [Anaerolineales bacterium]|nr:glutamate mutase L [Anaerolineales bacterium]MCB8954015.1 glutamate mutase L [Ardenticatenales bacterium]